MFNPGLFFEASRSFYPPETDSKYRMFKRPIVKASFDVWDSKNKVLFSLKEPLGKNKVPANSDDFSTNVEYFELIGLWGGLNILPDAWVWLPYQSLFARWLYSDSHQAWVSRRDYL